jgi:hypothetical protein
MPGRCALSAHGAGKLIVKTDGQTKTEKDTYAKLCKHNPRCHAEEQESIIANDYSLMNLSWIAWYALEELWLSHSC